MGISANMAVRMMADAGIPPSLIEKLLADLKPVARMDGVAYFNPNHVSRAIKRA